MSKQPTAWVRVDIVPVTGDSSVWQASIRPYADADSYQGGLKKGGVISFGDVERSLSDRSGSPVVTRFSFTVFDRDGFWRDLQNDPDTKYLSGSDVTFLMASIEAHTAPFDPRVLFRGQLVKPSPLSGRQYRVSAESRVGTRHGPFDLDAKVLTRLFDPEESGGWSEMPRELAGKAVPFLWGEYSDEGTVNEFDEDVASGMLPAYCLGPLPGNEPVYLSKPTWAGFQKYQNGSQVSAGTDLGGRTYTYIAGARTIDGLYSLSDPLTITGLPSPGGFTGDGSGHQGFGTGVALMLNPYTDPTELAAITDPVTGRAMAHLWVKDGGSDSTAKYNRMDAVDGEIFSAGGYHDNGDDSHYKGGTLPIRPLAQISPDAADFWCVLGHPGKITAIYGSDLGGGKAREDATDQADYGGNDAAYAAISADEIGTTFDLGPDETGITEVVNGKAYFGFYARGAKAEAAKDGRFPFRVNACGWHSDTGSPSGLLIDQAGYVYQDIFVQLHGDGYQSGNRLSIPSFASWPTIPILQSSAFSSVQDITKNYLGDDTGYTLAVYLGSADTTWRQLIEELWRSTQFDYGENHHGQILIATPDDEQDPEEGLLLREQIEIDSVQDAGEVQDEEIATVVRYQFDRHPISGDYRSGVITLRAPDYLIDKYGERVVDLDMPHVRDPATARDVASRHLLDRSEGPTYPAITAKFKRAITIELGQQYRIQHSDLITSDAVPLYLRAQNVSMSRGQVRLRGKDRRGTYAVQSAPDGTTGTNYSDATDAEKATYAFATDDDGRLPDGTLGSRAR